MSKPSYKRMMAKAKATHVHLEAIVKWESENGKSVLDRIAELEAENLNLRAELDGWKEVHYPITKKRNKDLENAIHRLLHNCQMAYLKHGVNEDAIGWNELVDMLADTLAEVMGDEDFRQWVKANRIEATDETI